MTNNQTGNRATNLYALLREMERTSVLLGMAPGALWVRVSPVVPVHVAIPESLLRTFLMRLVALMAVGSASSEICVDVQVCRSPESAVQNNRLRIEIYYSNSLPTGWRELGATAGIQMLPEGSVPWIELDAPEARVEETRDAEIGNMMVLGDADEVCRNTVSKLREVGVSTIDCTGPGAALSLMSTNAGSAIRGVLICEYLHQLSNQQDQLKSLLSFLREHSIPAYLSSDKAFGEEVLRRSWITAQIMDASHLVTSHLLAWGRAARPLRAGNVVPLPSGREREAAARLPAILVADDVEAVRMVLARVLESLGFIAHTARSGDEALTRLMDNSLLRYQAAILDISMPPGMSGAEVIRRYRERRPNSRLPMIVLTANDSRESQILAANAGADAYLAKPVSAESLRSTLEQLLAPAEEQGHTERTEPLQELPTIDWSVLAEIEKLYSSEAEVAQLIGAFASEANEQVSRIASAVGERDGRKLRFAAQTLKSLSIGIGASRLADVSRRIEELSEHPLESALPQMVILARTSLADVLALLSGLRR